MLTIILIWKHVSVCQGIQRKPSENTDTTRLIMDIFGIKFYIFTNFPVLSDF